MLIQIGNMVVALCMNSSMSGRRRPYTISGSYDLVTVYPYILPDIS